MGDKTKVYEDGRLSKIVDVEDRSDGSRRTTISEVHHEDIFGNTSSSIATVITENADGVFIKNK